MPKNKRIVVMEWDTLMLECTKCGEILPSNNFSKWSRWPNGLKYVCKKCCKKDYNINKEQILIERKEYYNKNKDTKKEYQKAYYYNNAEDIKNQHRVYRKVNKDIIDRKRKEKYILNKEAIKERNSNYSIKKSKELWFWWKKFHDKTSGYIKRHKLSPNKCSICGDEGRVIAHHPSYQSFEDWKNIVFVCGSCHQDIHKWNIECPTPIDLVKLKAKWQNKNKNLNDENGIV